MFHFAFFISYLWLCVFKFHSLILGHYCILWFYVYTFTTSCSFSIFLAILAIKYSPSLYLTRFSVTKQNKMFNWSHFWFLVLYETPICVWLVLSVGWNLIFVELSAKISYRPVDECMRINLFGQRCFFLLFNCLSIEPHVLLVELLSCGYYIET